MEDEDSTTGFADALREWRGKRSRREVGAALMEHLANLPDDERDPSVGADHIRLWETGRAKLPIASTQRVLASVLGVPLIDLEDAVGWERIRQGGATGFVQQLLERARDNALRYREYDEKIAPAEANMLAALRNLQGGPMANDVAAVFRALEADGGDLAPEVTEEMRQLTVTSPARVAAFAFSKLRMLPASVQHVLWSKFYESILPAEGLQHGGLPPDVVASYLSAPAYFAYAARTKDHNRRIREAAHRAATEDEDDERVDIATLLQFDHATRRYVAREGVVLDMADAEGEDVAGEEE